MPLVIEQTFPLGRFHATRWNQNPFEDRYGEWPPSPWRFLRALAARWIQYSRETGDSNDQARDELLLALAAKPPSFYLPSLARRGLALRQYHPVGLEEQYKYKKDPKTKKPVLDYSFRQVGRTLIQDHYLTVPAGEKLYWFWPELTSLETNQRNLLGELLRRIVYFGRAESFSRFRILESVPAEIVPNCDLHSTENGGRPVLVADPTAELDIKYLLASTDDRLLAGRRIPPGGAWYYARIQDRKPVVVVQRTKASPLPSSLKVIQFAVGGRIFPPPERWIKITERFRGETLNRFARKLTGNPQARYATLRPTERDRLRLLSGKDELGTPLQGHQQAYFILWPDEHGNPTRLVCWRETSFDEEEIETLLSASERIYSWEAGNPDWWVRLVPLPFGTPLPGSSGATFPEAARWQSATPFVPPGGRHRFRGKGRERPGEAPEAVLKKLIDKLGYPQPIEVGRDGNTEREEWIHVHETREERLRRRHESLRTPAIRRGFRLQITFAKPVQGPICLGHSSHFGLGLFVPAEQ